MEIFLNNPKKNSNNFIRDITGVDDAEKISIRLEVDGKSVCVESMETVRGGKCIR